MELLDDKIRIWIESAKFVKPMSGVYVLYDRSKDPIYIGETSNLEETFTKYVDTDFEGMNVSKKPRRINESLLKIKKNVNYNLLKNLKTNMAQCLFVILKLE